jgi:1,4-dihydroxy-6-naphthoate synthase
MPLLTLAHSPDPDDAFMWWPITGMVSPVGEPLPGGRGQPAIDTGRFSFRSLPADIEVLNRRAVQTGDLDITALSVRTYADVQDRYTITACGASFGDGFGPKLVARADAASINRPADLRSPDLRIAIPGRRTTAFMMLGMVLQQPAEAGVRTGATPVPPVGTFIEMPFDQIIGAVARREVDAGLVIHEGQLTFGDAGLKLIIDVGQWWKERTGLKLPLGINAVRGDLDQRYGPGSLKEVGEALRRSVAHAMDHWDESVRYTMAFAQANIDRGGGEPPSLERVDRYCRMYVSEETRDMGDAGREAIRRLLSEGAAAGLCPAVGDIELV